MAKLPQVELLGLDIQELTDFVQNAGHADYRARQLFEAIYKQRVGELDRVTTLPFGLRRELAESSVSVGVPSLDRQFHSTDGTIRYLIRFRDGQSVETVWMPEGDGGESGDGTEAGQKSRDRATICVSSQVGCAVDCRFCLTAALGLRRNLAAGEIVGQIIAVLNERGTALERERVNLVFMGQGEPFLNYDNFMKAVRLLVEGVGIPESRMTVSTSGIVPRIHDFGQEPVRPKLAISLNASNDAARQDVMPITRKWRLQALLAAARDFPLRPRERLTFEYVLLADVNDSQEDARVLVELLRGLQAKVNLIALNPGPGIPYGTPEEARVLAFQQVLVRAGIPAYIRRPRGRDIYAACGQLKQTVELAG